MDKAMAAVAKRPSSASYRFSSHRHEFILLSQLGLSWCRFQQKELETVATRCNEYKMARKKQGFKMVKTCQNMFVNVKTKNCTDQRLTMPSRR